MTADVETCDNYRLIYSQFHPENCPVTKINFSNWKKYFSSWRKIFFQLEKIFSLLEEISPSTVGMNALKGHRAHSPGRCSGLCAFGLSARLHIDGQELANDYILMIKNLPMITSSQSGPCHCIQQSCPRDCRG